MLEQGQERPRARVRAVQHVSTPGGAAARWRGCALAWLAKVPQCSGLPPASPSCVVTEGPRNATH